MILADKILMLRKQNGWSQEELAEMLQVSRQSISKWESGQSIPDIGRIITLSQIFGVSADFLIKDELETDPHTDVVDVQDIDDRTLVTLDDAQHFIKMKESMRFRLANAVRLCILSPCLLILLMSLTHVDRINLSENVAIAVGVVVFIALIAYAVYQFILIGVSLHPYKYLEQDPFTTEYGVSGIVKSLKDKFRPDYSKQIASGVVLCIVSAIPVIAANSLYEENEALTMLGMVALLLMVGHGVYMIVAAQSLQNTYNMLLQEDDFSPDKKRANKFMDTFGGIYWLGAVIIYLLWSFSTNNWELSWVVWPIATVGFGILTIITDLWVQTKE